MARRVALEGVFPTPLPEPRNKTLFIQDPRTTITPNEAHRLGRVIVNLTRAHHPPTHDHHRGTLSATASEGPRIAALRARVGHTRK